MAEKINAYRKRYKMRTLGADGLNIVVSIPRVVIEKEARSRSLSIGEFLNRFQAIAEYNNFDGVRYTFEEVTEEKRLSQVKRGKNDSGK